VKKAWLIVGIVVIAFVGIYAYSGGTMQLAGDQATFKVHYAPGLIETIPAGTHATMTIYVNGVQVASEDFLFEQDHVYHVGVGEGGSLSILGTLLTSGGPSVYFSPLSASDTNVHPGDAVTIYVENTDSTPFYTVT
jgi:hypothetical protein